MRTHARSIAYPDRPIEILLPEKPPATLKFSKGRIASNTNPKNIPQALIAKERTSHRQDARAADDIAQVVHGQVDMQRIELEQDRGQGEEEGEGFTERQMTCRGVAEAWCTYDLERSYVISEEAAHVERRRDQDELAASTEGVSQSIAAKACRRYQSGLLVKMKHASRGLKVATEDVPKRQPHLRFGGSNHRALLRAHSWQSTAECKAGR